MRDLRLGIALIVSAWLLAIVYVLVFEGALNPKATLRLVIAVAIGALSLSFRFSVWVLAVLGVVWGAEQAMWALRGAPDSIVFAVLLFAGAGMLMRYLLRTRGSSAAESG